MGDFDLVTAADVQLMQGLAQRVKGHACDGGTWARRLWFSGDALVAWGLRCVPQPTFVPFSRLGATAWPFFSALNSVRASVRFHSTASPAFDVG